MRSQGQRSKRLPKGGALPSKAQHQHQALANATGDVGTISLLNGTSDECPSCWVKRQPLLLPSQPTLLFQTTQYQGHLRGVYEETHWGI